MSDHIALPGLKALSAIGAAGMSQGSDTTIRATTLIYYTPLFDLTWPNIASFAAAAYSLCLVFEWFWKKFWRPLFLRKGWLPWLIKADVFEFGIDGKPAAVRG